MRCGSPHRGDWCDEDPPGFHVRGAALPDQTFQSNISISPGNQVYLERPQIDRLMELAVQNPVVIVNAGAGYGKTHAVYSFLRTCTARISWFQLSERDNIGERFWENFVSGISLGNPKAATRLISTPFPETDRDFERYMSIPEEDTEQDKKYIFVYDDFHLIHNKAVLRFLERSISAPFPNITSIFISRSEPPLNLTKFLSKGLLGRITEEELRFSQTEMWEYFRMLNVNPAPQTVSTIYRDTEGWAFAIHLAGLALKNALPGASYAPQAMRSNIFKLIESEIMDTVSAELRKFLVKLSLIDHLAPELLRKIAAGVKEEEPLIREMEQISSFIRFDAYLNAYRIHHLLLEYLSGKQHELSETEKREVYRQAAGWCAENNQKTDALSYYEKAEDYDHLITIADNLPLVLPAQLARFILELLNRLPPQIFTGHPLLYAVRARTLTSLSMFEQCDGELRALIPRIEALPPSPVIHWLLMALYANWGLIGIITSTYTGDYSFTSRLEQAAYHGNQTGGHVLEPPLSVINIGSYTCRVQSPEKAEMERFIDAIARAVVHLPAIGGCGWGIDVLARAELAFFRGDMRGAEQLSLQTLKKAEEWGQYEIENRAHFFLLRISLSRGDFERIGDIFRQMEARLDQVHYVNRFTYYDIVSGWYYVQTGQTNKLAAWLKNDFEESDLNSMAQGLEVLMKAKYHFAEKRYPAALAALEGRRNKYDAGDFVLGQIEIKVLEALCRYHLRNQAAAFAALEAAYRLARPNALYMPFIEMGKNMRALAGAALKDQGVAIPPAWLERVRRNASAYARKLFLAAGQRPQDGPPVKPRIAGGAALSPREMEVLTGLSQGLTREEIAGHSAISVNTVKSVIRSIYNKLGAVNRADAVRIAALQGLV
ncbi:MAG: LuxR C-terminal-related transcriptional regulator [Treponema sp.]|jgi:LuxR family maltose regulon positive regulatory protein|nr:LuxR C-terminal-related transcriptional regulator [Treponema sp.]